MRDPDRIANILEVKVNVYRAKTQYRDVMLQTYVRIIKLSKTIEFRIE